MLFKQTKPTIQIIAHLEHVGQLHAKLAIALAGLPILALDNGQLNIAEGKERK
jgi:hypothetical protein